MTSAMSAGAAYSFGLMGRSLPPDWAIVSEVVADAISGTTQPTTAIRPLPENSALRFTPRTPMGWWGCLVPSRAGAPFALVHRLDPRYRDAVTFRDQLG